MSSREQNLSDDLGFYFKRIDVMMVKQVNAALKEYGMTFSQMKVLVYILGHEGERINLRDIEERFELTHPTVVGILKRMEQKGLIESIQNPSDRRSRNIVPTQKAYEVDEEMKSAREKLNRSIASKITDTQLAQLRDLLELVYSGLCE